MKRSEALKIYNSSQEAKDQLKRLQATQSVSIEVLDLETGILTTYSSIKEAAEFMECIPNKISRYFSRNTKKPYRGRYVLKKVSN